MKNYFSSDFRLGVLGGGQLGRMLLTETQKLDIYTVILDSSADAPCAQICNEFHFAETLIKVVTYPTNEPNKKKTTYIRNYV